jgi:ankyrin repeat protein
MRILEQAGADTTLDPAAEWLGAVIRGEREHAERVRREHPGLRLSHDDAEDLPRWASAGDAEVVARLLDAGVPIDAPGIDGGTALHYAGMWGHQTTLRLLIERGADVEHKAGIEGSALGWTAWGSRGIPGAERRLDDYLDAAQALLDGGANVTARMVETAADELVVRLRERLE